MEYNYKLEEAYTVFTLQVSEGFFGYNSTKPELIWIHTCLKISAGNRPRGSDKWRQNVFCFFSVTNTIQPLLVILYQFLNYYTGFLLTPKNCPRSDILGGVLVISVQLKQHNFGQ